MRFQGDLQDLEEVLLPLKVLILFCGVLRVHLAVSHNHWISRSREQICSAEVLHFKFESIAKFQWVEEFHQSEELLDIVLERGPGEKDLELTMQGHALPEEARLGVFHLLALVNDDDLPLNRRKGGEITSKQVERSEQHVEAWYSDVWAICGLQIEVEL